IDGTRVFTHFPPVDTYNSDLGGAQLAHAASNCCWSVLGEGARGWRLMEHNAGTLPEPVLGDDD
ncbi:histidine phosphatase family protein, partial [Streptomyces sp. NPDC001193]